MKTLYQNLKLKTCASDTIARADTVFSYIDSDFENWDTDKKSPKTKETEVAVLEMTKDATFTEMFTHPEDMVLTQAQIIEFVKEHKDKLCTDGYNTFFLFKVDSCFFVARARFGDDGRLGVFVSRFSDDDVWCAEHRHRIVVPQLALKHFDSSPSDTLSFSARALEKIKRIENELLELKNILHE